MEILKKLLDKIISANDEKIRVLRVELIEVSDIIKGHFTYEITYLEDNEIKTEHILGKDVSDTLYRFGQIKKTLFNFKFMKRNVKG